MALVLLTGHRSTFDLPANDVVLAHSHEPVEKHPVYSKFAGRFHPCACRVLQLGHCKKIQTASSNLVLADSAYKKSSVSLLGNIYASFPHARQIVGEGLRA